jgi:hypothetical protein
VLYAEFALPDFEYQFLTRVQLAEMIVLQRRDIRGRETGTRVESG